MIRKERIDYFDIAKGIGILLVVAGHIFINQTFNDIVYSFHMPFFLIVSGMLIHLTNASEKPFKQLIISKFKSLLLPYIITELLIIPLYYLRGGYSFNDLHWIITDSLFLYVCKGSATWFLLGLFIAEIIYYFILKVIPNRYAVIGLCTLIYIATLIFTVSQRHLFILTRSLHMVFFLMLGHQFYHFFYKKQKLIAILLLLIAFIPAALLNGEPHMIILTTGNGFLYTITGVTGSILLITLSQYISSSKVKIVQYIKKHFIFWGQETVIVLCTHLVFLRYGIDILMKSGPYYPFFPAVVVFLIVMLLEGTLIFTKRKIKQLRSKSKITPAAF